MFSAHVTHKNRVDWPKNGPVPTRPVNGYSPPQFRRAESPDRQSSPKRPEMVLPRHPQSRRSDAIDRAATAARSSRHAAGISEIHMDRRLPAARYARTPRVSIVTARNPAGKRGGTPCGVLAVGVSRPHGRSPWAFHVPRSQLPVPRPIGRGTAASTPRE